MPVNRDIKALHGGRLEHLKPSPTKGVTKKMIERLKARRNSEEGFTLVELLVVIVILGILAAIVVFAVGGITDKGDSAATNTDIAVLQSAQEAVFAQAGIYASQQDLLDNKYIRSKSSKVKVCLATPTTATDKVVTINGVTQTFDDNWSGNYQIKAACDTGYTEAP